jgi:DNA-directed RNA polymerase subunit RPC12/RpoP
MDEEKVHMNHGVEYLRCPSCGHQGMRIQYGMPAGPPGPGVVLGGCIVDAENPDFLCSTCSTSWRLTPAGRVQIVDRNRQSEHPQADT